MLIDSFRGEYSFLSNFSPARVEYEGIEYPTTEHAYQAAKTDDMAIRRAIANLETPGQAKRAGKDIVLRGEWEMVKIGVMLELLRKKFKDPALAKKLLDTEDALIVEGNNWHDTYWGTCVCPQHGYGSNYLGSLLMQVRQELKDLETTPGKE